jgi:hypothetical protein
MGDQHELDFEQGLRRCRAQTNGALHEVRDLLAQSIGQEPSGMGRDIRLARAMSLLAEAREVLTEQMNVI